ncbi:FecR family protein [Aquimarina amphilecti]|uniref:FecR family protein n=1 Tax=Aquimarina amphilecti TaxID=1038014 RepID=A0A1H7TJ92_AQUAM|nr:FecR domain-containing protein [Aquimarina amphilecti]SEL84748.1 FecR family protein [Aquimarina amphilecti]
MNNYLTIIEKYLEGNASSFEKESLKLWLNEKQEHREFFEKKVAEWNEAHQEISVNSDKAFKRFLDKTQENNKVVEFRSLKRVLQYAAMFLGILGLGYYLIELNPTKAGNERILVLNEEIQEDRIKIVQDDGTVTYMDINGLSDVITTNGTVIGKKVKDKLVISDDTKNEEKLEYLEISIPKGRIFQLSLSDGTRIWMNADSKLKFPKNFIATEKNRIVYLQGEAFFDVATNKRQPFLVKTNGMDVKVLGTQFNVSSYQEDTTIKATLVEGSVTINTGDELEVISLKPNDQAIYSKDNRMINKKIVNTVLFTSWMQKKMIIQNESFAEVIKRLERTYDVEIISTNQKLNNTRFTGEFDIENVKQILNVFSKTINFKYVIENKRIVIAP